MKKGLFFMVLLCLVFLSGCVEYREDLVFNPDWSGHLSFSIGVGEAFDDFREEEIKRDIEQVTGLRVMASNTNYQEDVRWVEFDVEFDNLEALAGVDEIFKEIGFIGEITIEKDDQGNIAYTRKLTNKTSPETRQMLGDILLHYFWTYRTEFPEQVISANVGEIEEETNTVEWKINLAALASRPQMMNATIKRPQTTKMTWPVLMVGLVVLLVLLLCLYLYTIKGQKKPVAGIE